MGIRTKNLTNTILTLKYSGTLSATTNKDLVMVPFNGRISNVVAKIQGAGTGTISTVLDIHLNGTTIFGSATKITLAATTGTATYAALTAKPTNVNYGDIFTLDADSISTTPSNAIVEITVTKGGVADASNLLNQDIPL